MSQNNKADAETRILVADDAPDVRDRLCLLLEELDGVTVVGPASDGREAMELFLAHRPDGAVLDLQMPILSGLEVLLAIREVDSAVLVIVLTNVRNEAVKRRCLAAGANYFLHKATDFERLPEIIAAFQQVDRVSE